MLTREEKEKAYWEGYIAKQNEAVEICKQCKYIKKVKQLEADNYEQNNIINSYIEERRELIEKLEKFLKEIKQDGIYGYDGDILEILSILKGEKK